MVFLDPSPTLREHLLYSSDQFMIIIINSNKYLITPISIIKRGLKYTQELHIEFYKLVNKIKEFILSWDSILAICKRLYPGNLLKYLKCFKILHLKFHSNKLKSLFKVISIKIYHKFFHILIPMLLLQPH